MKSVERRSVLKAAATLPILSLAGAASVESFATGNSSSAKPVYVASGSDATGTAHSNPWAKSFLDFKVLTEHAGGRLFMLEQRNMPAGGPRRHMHFDEDEWFYFIDGGKVIFEVGDERLTLKPGDSVFAPRKVPHVWAHVGDKPGRMLVGFTPANKMQGFFEEITRRGGRLSPEESRTFGIEVLGPPLDVTKL
jgi:mannose-6-phosphate isomerase-like protein (cupin superfamily)